MLWSFMVAVRCSHFGYLACCLVRSASAKMAVPKPIANVLEEHAVRYAWDPALPKSPP